MPAESKGSVVWDSPQASALQNGVLAARAGRQAEARAHLSRAVREQPQNAIAWLWLACVSSNRTNARRALERVLVLRPGHPKATAWLKRLDELDAEAPPAPGPVVPLRKAAPPQNPETPPAAMAGKPVDPPADSPLILIADDSPTLRKILSLNLEKAGYRVLVAEDGITALAALSRQTPNLVILDIEMPNLDGYKVCRVIRQNQRTRSVPVLILSGKEGMFDKMRGRLVGANGYLTKPVQAADLLKAVAARLLS